VVKTAAEIIGPDQGTRSCYFDLQAGPPKALVPTEYHARRIGSTRSRFVEGTDGGDAAIAMVELHSGYGVRQARRRGRPTWLWPMMALLLIVVTAAAGLMSINAVTSRAWASGRVSSNCADAYSPGVIV
jgi:hypothetical protein